VELIESRRKGSERAWDAAEWVDRWNVKAFNPADGHGTPAQRRKGCQGPESGAVKMTDEKGKTPMACHIGHNSPHGGQRKC